ncbi:SH3 domain-containing protein [uncultured Sulfitobacter sp.]|uniref:SH3 domain-containing protein n=1 Tax=uncultured Sulfitobacter sp. TaxID=191468 RepID=UPI002614A841|nr:SH3 domain-containing protein [uncultured Sulfitobacter sp.]
MKTFILLTFGFLGFAFYEMSGGSDFEPASARLAAAEPQEAVTASVQPVAETPAEEAVINTASITKIDSTPSVTRVALNLTNVTNAAAEATQPETIASTATVLDSADTPQIILPSLIATTSSSDGTEVNRDIRTVSGNRVNVRGGPSTNYGIVSRLTRGEEVQILEDNGEGWVRMRPVDGGESGWMADFLLTSG